jgi:hypothetical protein
MRPSNPTRRNRNIGTAKRGHGRNNRMCVPQIAHGGNEFWERVDGVREVQRVISGRTIRFFVQPTLIDSVYACTVDDVTHLLAHIPVGDWEGIEAILFRQPRRKENILEPVWGRLAYAADFVDRRGQLIYQGPAIVIDAVDLKRPFRFGKKLGPEGLAELKRLESDGHRFRVGDTRNTIEPTLDACRATQLYRTFVHELGHWVDFLEKVERSAMVRSHTDFDRYASLLERFHSRPSTEKESFAHRYADRMRTQFIDSGLIPFARLLDREALVREKLSLADFLCSDSV